MSRKNISYIKEYIELDNACAEALGINRGGVSAYISELKERGHTGSDKEILKNLKRYRKIRNKLAHENDAIDEIDEITSNDIRWISSFKKKLLKKKDPISLYRKNIHIYQLWKKIKVTLIILAIIILVLILLSVFGVIK